MKPQELPKYKCHKVVQAVKINEVEFHPDAGIIIFPDHPQIAPFQLSTEYNRKHMPKKGGYFVVYEDGYQSYSPGEAFEKGYALIGDRQDEQGNAILVIRAAAVSGKGHMPANHQELRATAPQTPACAYCGVPTIETLIEDEDGEWIFAWTCDCEEVQAREGG
jgi:hypothetical protein